MKSYFRPAIDVMSGYTPGEQPKMKKLVKLNTNENPFPPAPGVDEVLKKINYESLRRYPDPMADELCSVAAKVFGLERKNIIGGNGSDDILTMTFRAFSDPVRPVAVLNPTYSLYDELAKMQEAELIKINLEDDFSLPDDLLEQAERANLLIITRPNAPSGNTFPLEKIREFCQKFDGIVFIDEAYGDFAPDNCMGLVKEFDNVIVSRTCSKSYSLAGGRLGFAAAGEQIIAGLRKLKDSYNLDYITQQIGIAALSDQEYLRQNVEKIKAERAWITEELRKLDFEVVESATNFVFAAPPDRNGEKFFTNLRNEGVIVRYFRGGRTAAYVRITIGTHEEMCLLLDLAAKWYKK